jgi:glycosyltransferase involved in cell wall biosynthesis
MYKNNNISVVVPAFNEAKHILKVIGGVPNFVDHIIVVNDCSRDRTAEVVRKINNDRVTLINHKSNQGVGGAIISGHKKALELKSDINIIMAGDNQMDPKYLPDLLDKLIDENYDYVKGNRFYSTKTISNMPKMRVFGNIMLSFLNKISSGYWSVFDPQNGYTAIKTKTLRKIDLDKIAQGYFFENSILIELNIIGAKVADVSIPARYKDENSKLKIFKIIVPFIFCLSRGFHRRIFYKYFLRGVHPIIVFLLSGAILAFWGMVFGLIKWHESSAAGVAASTGTVMLAVMPLLMGFQLLLWAVVMDIQEGNK